MNLVDILQFVGIPVAIATGIMLFSWRLFSSAKVHYLGPVIATGAACLAAFVLQEGFPAIPPTQKWHWLVLVTLVVSLLSFYYKTAIFQSIVAACVVSIFMQFPNQQGPLERILIGCSTLAVCIGLRNIKIPAWHMYLAAWWILAGYSLLALNASFAKLSFFAGAMSAVAAALCVLQIIKPREIKNVQAIFGTLIVGCAFCGLAYDSSGTEHQLIWFLPLLGVPISALVYVLQKSWKLRAIASLAVIDGFVMTAVIWSFISQQKLDETWP